MVPPSLHTCVSLPRLSPANPWGTALHRPRYVCTLSTPFKHSCSSSCLAPRSLRTTTTSLTTKTTPGRPGLHARRQRACFNSLEHATMALAALPPLSLALDSPSSSSSTSASSRLQYRRTATASPTMPRDATQRNAHLSHFAHCHFWKHTIGFPYLSS